MLAALRAASDRHGLAGSRVVVGLSGGRDSVALLHALAQLRGELRLDLAAHHVNHGLSPNAPDWARFCSELCGALGVAFTSARVDVEQGTGEGVEAAARAARYASFAALDADWIALAHHRGDQAETVLHNLLRGAGVRGLAGMPAERALPAGRARLVRPLLEVPRTVIEAYLAHYALAWIEDESNADSSYTRSWMRNALFPVLAQQFPAFETALARTAAHAAEAEALLDALAAHDLAAVAPAGQLRLDAFRKLDAARGRNLLRHLLREAGEIMPDASRLSELQRQLVEIDHDTRFVFELSEIELRIHAGALHLLRRSTHAQPEPSVPWNGEAQLDWLGGRVSFERVVGHGIAAARIAGKPCRLAPRRGGESIRPDAHRPRRSLKHWYQELGVPQWERERRPVLWCEDAVVWVPGVGIDMAFQCGQGEQGWVLQWVTDD